MCAWIKVDQTLLSHRKTLTVSEELDINEVAVIGHLVSLWTWAIDNAPNGELPASERMIARAAMWDGSPAHFVSALVFAGFIDDDCMGKHQLHNWEEWTGALVRSRRESTQRMKDWRQKKSQRERA